MRPLYIVITIAAALSISSRAVHAADPEFKAPSTELSTLAAGKYELEKTHANVLFKISHLGYSTYIGRFDNIDAMLDFNTDDVTKSTLEATVYPGSVNTTSDELNAKLADAPFFDIEQFPAVTFRSIAIEKTGADTGVIHGELTLLGVTKPVTLNTTFNGGGDNPYSNKAMLGFSASTTIKRSDFGMNAYTPAVGDEVKLEIEVEFQKVDGE